MRRIYSHRSLLYTGNSVPTADTDVLAGPLTSVRSLPSAFSRSSMGGEFQFPQVGIAGFPLTPKEGGDGQGTPSGATRAPVGVFGGRQRAGSAHLAIPMPPPRPCVVAVGVGVGGALCPPPLATETRPHDRLSWLNTRCQPEIIRRRSPRQRLLPGA